MKLKYEMSVLDIDGSPMAIPLGCNDEFCGVLHMNGTTADILEALKNEVSENDIISELKKEYDATEDQLRHSVQKVIGILREHNLITG